MLFKKGRQCFLTFFNYCLQPFSSTFTNYFKSFLGSYTLQGLLDVTQTKQSKREGGKGCKKNKKIAHRLIRFQMAEKNNSSELLCEKL